MTFPTSKSQREQILDLLLNAHGQEVPSVALSRISLQYGARVKELRELGFRISNRTERRAGRVHGYFRLEAGSVEQQSSSVKWIDGHIPDDQRALGRLCRLDATAISEVWETLCQFFPIVEPGKRANRFMWVERERVIADLERRSDEGTRAARKRWAEKKTLNAKPIPHPLGHLC